MILKQVIEIADMLDSAHIDGETIVNLFSDYDFVQATAETVQGREGTTDFIKIIILGENGKLQNGNASSLGIIGRLGGIGARPKRIGFVSDGDGAAAALSTALKLAEMSEKGDRLEGDVYITTHICPHAPTKPHKPVEFMGSPVDILTMNQYEVDEKMDAIISIDTTKGNNVFNHKGISLSQTVKEGYILKFSEDLIRTQEMTTGELPATFALSMQDITPYGNGLHHINSILQPSVATNSPVVGVAITAESAIPGSGTGASHEIDIAQAARFSIEVAKEFGKGTLEFFDKKEFEHLRGLYGAMNHLQTKGID